MKRWENTKTMEKTGEDVEKDETGEFDHHR